MVADVRESTVVNPAIRGTGASVPKLVAVSGPSAGKAFAIARATATVGRHPTNDFVLEDARVSGAHLELSVVGDGRVYVRDLRSTNGTWLGPHRVVEVEVRAGAELTIGDSTLRFGTDDNAHVSKAGDRESFGELVGQSSVMRELFSTLERIAPTELSVLVQGEAGTGKEEVARAIHAASPRASGPFVVIDATALPDALTESLLFGHEKGDFGGAHERQTGVLEAARDGTVFFDEIGELPYALQSKLLRALERREVTRVGGHTPLSVDVRVIAACHRDLRNAIDKGRFREDLYFRLAQVRVFVPPLRQHVEDLALVCAKVLGRLGSDVMIDVEALEYLASMSWPGNVRELNNVLIRASALAQGGIIRRPDVAGEGDGFRGTRDERAPLDLSGKFSEAKERAIERFERAYLALLMKGCQGNLSAASRQADVARHHLRDLLKKRGLYGVSLDEQ